MQLSEAVSSLSGIPSHAGLSMESAQEILNRITYKPGFKLWMDYGFAMGGKLHIEFSTSDSNAPNRLTFLRFCKPVELPFITAKTFLFFVMDSIKQVELHEFDEWLKLDGKNITDPHPPRPL